MDEGDMPLRRIERAVAMTERVVDGIRTDQWSAVTPCTDWTVRDVLNHVVGGMRIFAAELAGAEPDAEHDADWLGADPVAAYATAAELDVAAWRGPTALAGTVTISLGTLPGEFAAVIHLLEVLVHGVDLAVATDQVGQVDEHLCATVHDLLLTMGGVDAHRVPGVFGPEVTTDPGAAPHERLSGYLGRDVRRRSAAMAAVAR